MKTSKTGTFTGIGIMVGAVLYALTDSAVWIPLGLVLGAAVGTAQDKKKGDEGDR